MGGLSNRGLKVIKTLVRPPEQVTIPSNTPRPNGGLVASDRGGCGFPGARN